MLQHLHISQYALIETLDIDFCQGFNVITGETGAGKSIIMGALGLVMGARADVQAIRRGADKCVVEATFVTHQSFEELADYDVDDEIIIRREITARGKSRAFVNDTPIPISELRQVAGRLVDIHSQHENLLLNNADFQLNIVDTVADTRAEAEAYTRAYVAHRDLLARLNALRSQAQQSATERDYIDFQHKQLMEAALVAGEQPALEQEQERLEHAEEIKTDLVAAAALMDDDEHGVLTSLSECVRALRRAARFVAQTDETAQSIDERLIDLKEFAADIRRAVADTEVDPERLSYVEQRLSTLYSLEQKHGLHDADELIALSDELALKLERMEGYDAEIAELEAECKRAKATLRAAADALSAKRRAALPGIESYLVERLRYLGMDKARVQIAMEPTDPAPRGADAVEFRFSANKNAELQAIARVASGGEIARVMLALKALMVDTLGLETIVFDEIDTGVSGEMARRMGDVMATIAASTQVITITHLPQIAARGGAHFRVYKRDNAIATVTNIVRLGAEEREREIAEMLSGHNPTDSAILAARELLGGKPLN